MKIKKLNVIFIILLLFACSTAIHAQERAGELAAGRFPIGSGTPVRLTPDEAVELAIKTTLGSNLRGQALIREDVLLNCPGTSLFPMLLLPAL